MQDDDKEHLDRIHKMVHRLRWLVVGIVLIAAVLIILQAILRIK